MLLLCAFFLLAPPLRAQEGRQRMTADKPATQAAPTSAPAAAQDPQTAPPAWSGQMMLGVQRTSGSSDFLSVSAENVVNYRRPATEVTFVAAGRYGSSTIRSIRFDSEGNPEEVRRTSITRSYHSELNGRFSFHTRAYWVARAGWEGDHNQAIDHRISLKAGMGVRLFSDATRELRVELLGGYLGEHHANGESLHVPALALTVALRHAVGAAAKFDSTNHVVENLDATHDVLIISRNTLNVNVVRRLGLVLSYQLTYDRHPSGALLDPSGGERLQSAPKGLNTHLIVSGSIGW